MRIYRVWGKRKNAEQNWVPQMETYKIETHARDAVRIMMLDFPEFMWEVFSEQPKLQTGC